MLCLIEFKLQLQNGKEEAKKDWEQKKKEISNLLHTINVKIEEAKDDRSEDWDHFSDEMRDAWNHIKRAFKN